MGLAKKISAVIIINCIIIFILVFCLVMGVSPSVCFCFFAVIEIIMLIMLYFFIGKPLRTFEIELEQCAEENITDSKLLENVSDDIVFMKKIKALVEKCSNRKIRENSAEMFDKQAELAALQSQINPHFLYNTLESIRGQALIDDNYDIAKMVEALAAYFRYSINRKAELVTLRDELANIQNYMMILRYRFNNRFSLEIFIDEEDKTAYDCFIPKLILQPVVENAVFHGLEECLEGGKIVIEVIQTENNLILTVSDNGKGMNGKVLSELNKRIRSASQYNEKNKHNESKQRNTGIALPNIHKRIQLLFGEEFGVNVYSTLNQGTDVEITIPANYERNSR